MAVVSKNIRVRWNGKAHRRRDLAEKSLATLRSEHNRYQGTRERNAVYGYLKAVYGFIRGFELVADCKKVARVMARDAGHVPRSDQDRFALIFVATSDVDHQRRWKWSRCLSRAAAKKVAVDDLQTFIAGEGGINGCAKGKTGRSSAKKRRAK